MLNLVVHIVTTRVYKRFINSMVHSAVWETNSSTAGQENV